MFSSSQTQSLIEGNSIALIIEDDRMVSTLLKSFLEKSGFIVYQVHQGESAEEAVKSHQPDVVILDIGLPDVDGYEVCQRLRRSFNGPIMMLTAKDEEQDEIQAFYSGADDYLIKPVSPAILKVRAESLIRRSKERIECRYNKAKQVGNLKLDTGAHKCFVDQQSLKLSSFEFKLLRLLVENVGNVLSRDRIYKVLLKRDYNGTERTVDVRMAKLREKLGYCGLKQAQIETVWGQGYVLNEVNQLKESNYAN
ncbi:response regulator transcription factor [Thalassotalea sp. M1531]|uniref:Response regulator transcription factor n=1 Tax=Thalassotalea algicola TaxID=2716224 RepID=A0A7Y0L9V9_9GAMM|nr:response regulator transcription factor [Thalassotalea algicola]NMP30293.1 response regulator transcription factor [Thalassotalea algicola]